MKEVHDRYATLPYANTLRGGVLRRWSTKLIINVFAYGRGTENRTLINRLKAYYFAVKLYPRHLITLVTCHDRSPFKKLVLSTGIDPASPP